MENPPVHEPVFLIEVGKISSNPFQPRKIFDEESLKELANSIREFGLLQPLVVTKVEEDTDIGTSVRYELIAGERRLRACQLLGLERVPAIVKSVALDQEKLEMAIVENVQRADLNPIESARAYNRLQDEFKLTQREIATRIGKSRETVANTMRLLNLPTKVQEALSGGLLGESQARLLLSIDDVSQQQLLFEDILKNNLSVRELKHKIDYLKAVERRPKVPAFDPVAESVREKLEESLGINVKVENSGKAGKITLSFGSPEELYNLMQKLAPQGDGVELKDSQETPSLEEEDNFSL